MKTWMLCSVRVLVLVLGVASCMALEMRPSVARSSDVFVGTIITAERVKVKTVTDPRRDWKWEVWRAEVQLKSVVKQDTSLDSKVVVYFGQDHDGYILACPAWPRVVTGGTYGFFCYRSEFEGAPNKLWVSDALSESDFADALAFENNGPREVDKPDKKKKAISGERGGWHRK